MLLKFFALSFWNRLSDQAHKLHSQIFSQIFISKVSRLIILPYCLIYGLSDDDLNYFVPESGAAEYTSFGDFFKRKFKSFPESKSEFIWPCEGYVCDWGYFSDKMITDVKGSQISPRDIFYAKNFIPENYFFTNIFLHNHNYHRVHSPISGKITHIESIAGGLSFLRPWLYKRDQVSWPALKNERLNIEITDSQNRVWYLSMVGGFGVGTIKLNPHAFLQAEVKVGEELGWFELGSTVCLATPIPIKIDQYLQLIQVGSSMEMA